MTRDQTTVLLFVVDRLCVLKSNLIGLKCDLYQTVRLDMMRVLV